MYSQYVWKTVMPKIYIHFTIVRISATMSNRFRICSIDSIREVPAVPVKLFNLPSRAVLLLQPCQYILASTEHENGYTLHLPEQAPFFSHIP